MIFARKIVVWLRIFKLFFFVSLQCCAVGTKVCRTVHKISAVTRAWWMEQLLYYFLLHSQVFLYIYGLWCGSTMIIIQLSCCHVVLHPRSQVKKPARPPLFRAKQRRNVQFFKEFLHVRESSKTVQPFWNDKIGNLVI